MYSIKNYVIKTIRDLRQVGGILWVLRFPPPKKNDRHDITEIVLKVALNTTITLTLIATSNIEVKLYLHSEPLYSSKFILLSNNVNTTLSMSK